MIDELRSAHFQLSYAQTPNEYKSQAAISHLAFESQYNN